MNCPLNNKIEKINDVKNQITILDMELKSHIAELYRMANNEKKEYNEETVNQMKKHRDIVRAERDEYKANQDNKNYERLKKQVQRANIKIYKEMTGKVDFNHNNADHINLIS